MIMNQLLSYVSYRGSGTMAEFFATCRSLGMEQPWSGLRNLSDLGHMEYTWLEPSGWAVAPPVLAPLPVPTPTAVLCGGRSAELVHQLRRSGLTLDTRPQALGPDIWVIRAPHQDALRGLASAVGLACAPEPPAWTLARCLSPLDEYILESSPPVPFPTTYSPHWFDPSTGQFSLETMVNRDGLWRYQDRPRGGRTRYLLRQSHQILQVSDPDAVRLQLRTPGQTFASYDLGTQSVLWRRWHPLPRLYARALVLCSGLLPLVESDSLRYVGVPQALAMLVFGRLGLSAKEVLVA